LRERARSFYLCSRQPRLLSDPQIAAVKEKFATYGYGGTKKA